MARFSTVNSCRRDSSVPAGACTTGARAGSTPAMRSSTSSTAAKSAGRPLGSSSRHDSSSSASADGDGVLDSERLLAGGVFERLALEVIDDQIGARFAVGAAEAAVLQTDDGAVVELPQRLGLGEDDVDAAVDLGVGERLDDHRRF